MIEVNHLTKKYGTQVAVSDLSFTIENGQIYGLLGPNGAGKTTTMNIMTGCLAATSGDVKIDGYDIFDDALQAKKRIGYLPEQPPLYTDRTPREYLSFVGRAKGIPAGELKEQVDRVMEYTQITSMQSRLIHNLSKGYKQRVGIAQAILGDPEVIILDEPTVGLDPHQIIEIRDLITQLGKEHTIILSSHILSEVSAVCTTIMIINHGKLIACDTPENLERLMTGTTTIKLAAGCSGDTARALLEPIEDLSSIEMTGDSGERCSFTLRSDSDDSDPVCRELFFAFAGAGIPILEMSVARASLEEVFIELTGSDAPEPGTEDEENEDEDDEDGEVEIEVEVDEEDEEPLQEGHEEQGLHYDEKSPLLEDLEIDPDTLEVENSPKEDGKEDEP